MDMAAFAVNVKTLVSHPTVRMGYKPGQDKRSTPGYLEPDFLKSLGAKRENVECRGASDEVRGEEGEGRGREEREGKGREREKGRRGREEGREGGMEDGDKRV